MKQNKILVMGIGNYLMGDEGLGVHTVQQLQQEGLPGVDFLDGGTGGFHLLSYFENYRHIILVDATLDGVRPGAIQLIRPRVADDFPRAMSARDVGLKDLVGALQLLGRMPDIHLFVVSIASAQQQGTELSEEIKEAIDVLKEKIAKLSQGILRPATVFA